MTDVEADENDCDFDFFFVGMRPTLFQLKTIAESEYELFFKLLKIQRKWS